jgi:isopentenyl phosphate kinase
MTIGCVNGSANRADQVFLILKIGGSVFSDKERDRHVDQEAIRGFARLVAELSRRAPGRIALVVGGGSFGHGAVRHLHADDRVGALKLTEAAFAQKWIWTEALRDEGAPAVPLQLTAMCTLDRDGPVFSGAVLERVLALGLLPVLSGDCLIATDGALRVYGSDRVPQLLMGMLAAPARVVALTDVPGIIDRSADDSVLREVDPDDPREALERVWKTSAGDATQGMEGKLQALLECAHLGAECVVTKGDPTVESLMFLYDEPDDWPAAIGFTRIKPSSPDAALPPTG